MSEITVVESDAAGRPTVIDVDGEGRCEVQSWRQDAETGEWVITSYALVEPSQEWIDENFTPPPPPPALPTMTEAVDDWTRHLARRKQQGHERPEMPWKRRVQEA